MGKLNLSKIARTVQASLIKHSPEILTGMGIAGLVTTTVLAVKATPKALSLIEDEVMEKNDGNSPSISALPSMVSKKDLVRITWKCYIPSAVTGTLSVACLIGASRVSARRNAALATAYKLSETALTEYREKVVETIGETKEQAIRDKVAQDKIDKDPVSNREVIITGKGETLCYDSISQRYFRSDIEKIRKAENLLNKRLMNEMFITVNEYYYEIGLKGNSFGEEFGWDVDRGLIDISFSAGLSDEDEPCLVVGHLVPPDYRR